MTLRERLDHDLKEALKQGEKGKLSTLRMIRADIRNVEIDKRETMDEKGIMDILARYGRKRKDAALEFRNGGREDLFTKEMAEYEVVQAYLPQAMNEDELTRLVDEVIEEEGADSMKQMGAVMKVVLERAAGRADGGSVSAIVKGRLSK
ncbi:MAG: GatB/YqeY domain-containing protein [bacterium]|nr:GatB/YqeY domain-containing protein [bacterium]